MDYTSLIKEVNIPELVKALRLCQFGECGCGKCYYKELKGDWCTEDNHPEFFDCDDKLKLDAAAAIEALQAELNSVIADAGARIGKAEAEVKRLNGLIDAQLVNSEPKRGEWIIVSEIKNVLGDTITKIKCPFCAERKTLYSQPLPKYCDSCGAKMEVQDEQE